MLDVEISSESTTYSLREGAGLVIRHEDETISIHRANPTAIRPTLKPLKVFAIPLYGWQHLQLQPGELLQRRAEQGHPNSASPVSPFRAIPDSMASPEWTSSGGIWSPALELQWDATGDGKTAVRVGDRVRAIDIPEFLSRDDATQISAAVFT